MSQDDLSRPVITVDLVLFTIVEEKELRGTIWDDSLVSPRELMLEKDLGMSLFVVTKQDFETGKRVLPGDFVQANESIAQAADRVARDQLGIYTKVRLRDVGVFDNPDRGDHSNREISFPYWGFVRFEDLRKVLGGRDQVGLELVNSKSFMREFDEKFNLDRYDGVSRFGYRKMPTQKTGHEKAFSESVAGHKILGSDHDEIVFYAWRKLRHAFTGKLDPFRFLGTKALGEAFRISDLQEFQDVARGVESQRDQFRRQVLSEGSFLKASAQMDSSRPGKPATLYELDADIDSEL